MSTTSRLMAITLRCFFDRDFIYYEWAYGSSLEAHQTAATCSSRFESGISQILKICVVS